MIIDLNEAKKELLKNNIRNYIAGEFLHTHCGNKFAIYDNKISLVKLIKFLEE